MYRIACLILLLFFCFDSLFLYVSHYYELDSFGTKWSLSLFINSDANVNAQSNLKIELQITKLHLMGVRG